MQRKNLNIAMAGLGTVGCGVVANITKNSALINKRTGRKINIVGVSAKNKGKKRTSEIAALTWYDDVFALVDIKNVDVIIELIGGEEKAYELCKLALTKGKHVVTANKAMIARYGKDLAKLAEKNKVTLSFEAAVAGAIPIIKYLKESIVADNVSSIYGIMNGTCNYILSQMEATGKDFTTILKNAQDCGYAEADPKFDVEGIDTAHKLAILVATAFGVNPNLADMYIDGIDKIEIVDIRIAEELGYKVKLLGIAKVNKTEIYQHVYPVFISHRSKFANINDVDNAVLVNSEFAGKILLSGAGAGAFATAAAVMSDITDIMTMRNTYSFGLPCSKLKQGKFTSLATRKGAYYIRINVEDKAGVMSDITTILTANKVSIDKLIQKNNIGADGSALIAIITHIACENDVRQSLQTVSELHSVVDIMMIRVEDL